ncbi:hypothetical protein QCA50_003861 [Cerrena zonata]|uniref:3-carboxymuconate cyclase n=1 Tax=Cerrena zonata TaxID=2478898 RepID=A0AAW0GRQ3_9APHY
MKSARSLFLSVVCAAAFATAAPIFPRNGDSTPSVYSSQSTDSSQSMNSTQPTISVQPTVSVPINSTQSTNSTQSSSNSTVSNNSSQSANSTQGADFLPPGFVSKQAGALYFINNDPSGNFVIVGEIQSNGAVVPNRAVATGGKGAHGVSDPIGPDPLFSQGAIKATSSGKMLATVNPGDNTISLFSVDPKNPVDIKMIGQPVNSGGEFPVSVAFNKDGNVLCALNGGKVNGVQCFSASSKGLEVINNSQRSLGLNQTTPANGPPNTPSHVIFNEAGDKLVASVKGTPPADAGFIAVWDVAKDGSLSTDFTKITAPAGGLLPFSMTNINGMNAILATDAGVGFDIFDLSTVKNTQDKGNQTSSKNSATAINGQKATCWSSFSAKTGSFYLTDVGTSTITEVSVDKSLKGKIVKQFPQANNSATIDNDVATIGKHE